MREPTQMERRVARAIWASYLPNTDPNFVNTATGQPNWMGMLGEARAAIRAMREVDSDMDQAAEPHMGGESGFAADFESAWQSAIDAASPPIEEK